MSGGMKAALRQKLLVISLLDDVAVLHDKNQVRIADRRQPVSDHKASAALHQLIHRPLDPMLRAGIDGARGLVQNHNGIVGQDRSRDGQKLLLSLSPLAIISLAILITFPNMTSCISQQNLKKEQHLQLLSSNHNFMIS